MIQAAAGQKRDRRRQLLDAALRCFSRNGFHNTTTADIVRDAGVAQGTFYLYFKTKADVIAALADDEDQSDALISGLAAAQADPIAGLTVLFNQHGGTLASAQHIDEHRVRIQGWAEALRDDAIRDQLLANNARVEREIVRLIERGQRTGQFRADAEPQGFARALIALFRGLTLQAAWEGRFDAGLTATTIEDMVRGALLPAGGHGAPRRKQKSRRRT
ncbi:MAG TPA: TetR/AcrR family transcriptional regulator [Rhizomicrobium sp.]|nr:TetR/AcrR family transcriptional regulator [Rhizomicrobium sp.]